MIKKRKVKDKVAGRRATERWLLLFESLVQKQNLDYINDMRSDSGSSIPEATSSTASPLSTKRAAVDDIEDDSRKEKRRNFCIDQKNRLEAYRVLRGCKSWSDSYPILDSAYKAGNFELAVALHDSTEEIRLMAFSQLDDKMCEDLLGHLSDLGIHKERYDPHSLFPSVVTRRTLRVLLQGKIVVCHLCKSRFSDGQEVVWKNCKNHLMHRSCFTSNVKMGELPLVGPCACLGEAC